jgi:hypothetical protein
MKSFVYRFLRQLAEMPSMKKVMSAAMAGLLATGSFNLPAMAITKAEVNQLSYEQVKGSGLANRCPETSGQDTIAISGGKKYKITDLCLEPKTFQVHTEMRQSRKPFMLLRILFLLLLFYLPICFTNSLG